MELIPEYKLFFLRFIAPWMTVKQIATYAQWYYDKVAK